MSLLVISYSYGREDLSIHWSMEEAESACGWSLGKCAIALSESREYVGWEPDSPAQVVISYSQDSRYILFHCHFLLFPFMFGLHKAIGLLPKADPYQCLLSPGLPTGLLTHGRPLSSIIMDQGVLLLSSSLGGVRLVWLTLAELHHM